MLGKIHSFETMGALDGPGLRFIVFMQGCPLRCVYCHNPDTWDLDLGEEIDSSEVIRRVQRFAPYFKNKKGGVTLSGGEPLLQAKFCKEIFKELREKGIHTALDTSGCILNEEVEELLEYTDLVILDIKHANQKKFKDITGRSMDNTLAFLRLINNLNIPLWIRQVVVPGINDFEEDIEELSNLLKEVKTIERTELLPYHRMGVQKWENIGLKYTLEEIEEPTEEKMESLREVLRNQGFNVF